MILFAYDFPHRKTNDFIVHCVLRGYKISAIIAAPPVKLDVPNSTIRSKIRHETLYHPKELAKVFDIPYKVLEHNSNEAEEYLQRLKPKIGLIAGARILKANIIKKFDVGIINFHPGLIPETRGLDALFWSIINNHDLGITSHLIDERIDAGKLLEIRRIPLYTDDTLFDLSERLYEIQIKMIDIAIQKAMSGDIFDINYSKSTYNRKMPPELEEKVEKSLSNYLRTRLQ